MIKPTAKQLAQINPTKQLPWVAQAFVTGDESSTYAFAQDGQLLALGQYQSLYWAGRGAVICFGLIDDPAVTDFVRHFVVGTNWTGQMSFDMIRQADGTIDWVLDWTRRVITF